MEACTHRTVGAIGKFMRHLFVVMETHARHEHREAEVGQQHGAVQVILERDLDGPTESGVKFSRGRWLTVTPEFPTGSFFIVQSLNHHKRDHSAVVVVRALYACMCMCVCCVFVCGVSCNQAAAFKRTSD